MEKDDMTLKDFEDKMSVRLANCLESIGIMNWTIEKVKTLTGGQLISRRNFGLKTLKELEDLIGYSFPKYNIEGLLIKDDGSYTYDDYTEESDYYGQIEYLNNGQARAYIYQPRTHKNYAVCIATFIIGHSGMTKEKLQEQYEELLAEELPKYNTKHL